MFWKGPVFTSEGFVGKGINLENCSISNDVEGEENGIIIPLFRNCHTHLGDTLARNEMPHNLSLSELVGPNGWKHKWLENNDQNTSAIAGLKEIINSGTGLVMDFREGGKAGLDVFDGIEYPGKLILLGRPLNNENLPGTNAGISSLIDVKNATEIAASARSNNGLVGIHHSENEREEIQPLLDLRPDFVVHMCHATESDLREIKANKISIVVCPRSNHYFGNKKKKKKMIELGIDIGFGTDNGMLCTVNMMDEIRFIRAEYDSLNLKTILSIACFGLDDIFNKDGTSTYSNMAQSGWVLLSRVEEDNYESIFNPNTEILGIRWRN